MARTLPPLSSLRPFEAAARLESFSRAAGELHLTHGAVSHQVRALEEFLGAPLFARHGKRVVLTAQGRAFADRVRRALEEIAAAAADARATKNERRLGVSVLPSFASRWLMPRLVRFMEAHPDIDLSVDASVGLADFASGAIDLAIRFGRGPWPPLVCEMFLEDEYFPVASPRLAKKLRQPADLLHMRIIHDDGGYWTPWFAAAGVPLQAPVAGPVFNDATYALQSAARGEGVALARRSIVGEDLERGVLKRLFTLAVPSNERYWFVSPRETAQAPKVRAFRDWVKAELAAEARAARKTAPA
jgi:LysR family transcriptional regulator, glycine cleavage system transcriptional activator